MSEWRQSSRRPYPPTASTPSSGLAMASPRTASSTWSDRACKCRAGSLDGFGSSLTRPDPQYLLDGKHDDFPISNVSGPRRPLDGPYHSFDVGVVKCQLDASLGYELDLVFRAPVHLGLSRLAAEAPYLGHGHPGDSDLAQGILDFFEFEGFDISNDQLHEPLLFRKHIAPLLM